MKALLAAAAAWLLLLPLVVAQPGLGQGLPQRAEGRLEPGNPEDFRAVGARMDSPVARGKFRAPADTDEVLDSEYIVTFEPQTPPSVIEEAARQVQAASPGVRFRLIATDPSGWQGLAYKVPPQAVDETAAVLQSLLVLPTARSGEANMIVRALRPVPADTDAAAPAAEVPAAVGVSTTVTETAAAALPTGPVQIPAELAASTVVDPTTLSSAAGTGGDKTSGPVSTANAVCPTRSGTVQQTLATNSGLWGLDRIDTATPSFDGRYSYSSRGAGVNVFVADTGVMANHQEFGGRVLMPGRGGFDAFGGTGSDRHGHGTHCAGTIGGATVGVANAVTLVAVKVLDDRGAGTVNSVVAGINHATNSQLPNKILSMSLGGGRVDAIDSAVASATNAGVLVVVAAGNSNVDACNTSPAREPSALTVGATRITDAKSSFSNFGPCVDIWAPGEGIRSAVADRRRTDTYAVLSGTSMAAPHVAGVAARFWSSGLCNSASTCSQAVMCSVTRNILSGFSPAQSSNSNPFLHIPAGI